MSACQTILVIDDDHDTRVLVRTALEEAGHFVFSAANGQDGIETLTRIKPPGLILLDLRMPIYSGWRFLEEKAKHLQYAAIPVVVISAEENFNSVDSGQVVAFVSKPLNIVDLIKVVDHHCGIPAIRK